MDPSLLWWALGAAVALPLLLIVLIAATSYKSVMAMASGRTTMELLNEGELALIADRIAPADEWATANGFEWQGAFAVKIPNNVPATMVVWQRPMEDVYFALYLVLHNTATDFVTSYAPARSLTTASTADGMLYPSMEQYAMQAFTGLTLDELWVRHQESSRFLEGRGWRRMLDARPIEEIVLEVIQIKADFVRAHFAWPLRAVWWYMTRKQRANIPVAEQRLAGFGA